jgi:hypothetical protein
MHQNLNHTHEQTIKEPNPKKESPMHAFRPDHKEPFKYKKETNDKQKPKPKPNK